MHKLIDVKHNPKEKKKLRKWSGACKCKKWFGSAPNEDVLKAMWRSNHLRDLI